MESALDAFSTSIQDIEQRLPRNCTIGTRRACVRYLQNTTCFDTPLNLSSLFSSVTFESSGTSVGILDEFVSDAVAQLQPLAGRLSGVSLHFQRLLMVGSLLTAAWAFVCTYLFHFFTPNAGKISSHSLMVILSLAGVTCCAPFLALVVLLSLLRAQETNLPYWMEATSGSVSDLCSGVLACAVIMVLLTVIILTLSRRSRPKG